MSNAFIKADNISVEFPVYNASHRSLKKAVIRATTGGRVAAADDGRVAVRAIDNASFEFHPGDRVGLVGHNGSGKTTLLRVLSGVYEPFNGKIETKGDIVSLLDLSLGMDSESTGFENIFLRGVMMGMRPKEIESKIEEIAEFSELGNYLNMPIRTYSSGMSLRLAFATSTSMKADIILMDEWLSVGDADFNQKASRRLESMVESSSILVLASHSKTLVEKLCNRVFSLEHGIVREIAVQDIPF
jgi:lipopolysaccharide transport system ATP-binding protein